MLKLQDSIPSNLKGGEFSCIETEELTKVILKKWVCDTLNTRPIPISTGCNSICLW